MFTQQDRANVGSKLSTAERNTLASAASLLRRIAAKPRYRKDETFDTDVLGDLADQLDQIAMPIVVERKA